MSKSHVPVTYTEMDKSVVRKVKRFANRYNLSLLLIVDCPCGIDGKAHMFIRTPADIKDLGENGFRMKDDDNTWKVVRYTEVRRLTSGHIAKIMDEQARLLADEPHLYHDRLGIGNLSVN